VSRVRGTSVLLLVFAMLACRSAPPSVAPEPAPASGSPSEPSSQGGATAADTAPPSPPRAARPTSLGPLAAHFAGPAPEGASHVVLLLHGFGDQGNGLALIARELAAARAGLGVVALEGLLPHPQGGRMWWPIDIGRIQAARASGHWPDLERERAPGVDAARDAVVAALEELRSRGVPRERITLAGFSQGAMLSVEVGLAHPELLGAVVAWSGAIIDRTAWEQRLPGGVRFTVVHGRRDTVLPFAQGEALHALLRRVDPTAAWVPFDGPHTVSAEGRAALLQALPAP
jgi:phospholipase/carboxylesterase